MFLPEGLISIKDTWQFVRKNVEKEKAHHQSTVGFKPTTLKFVGRSSDLSVTAVTQESYQLS